METTDEKVVTSYAVFLQEIQVILVERCVSLTVSIRYEFIAIRVAERDFVELRLKHGRV